MGDQHPMSLVQSEDPSISFINPLAGRPAGRRDQQLRILSGIFHAGHLRRLPGAQVAWEGDHVSSPAFGHRYEIYDFTDSFLSFFSNFQPVFMDNYEKKTQLTTTAICWSTLRLTSMSSTVSPVTGSRHSIWSVASHSITMASYRLLSPPNSLTSSTCATSTKVNQLAPLDHWWFWTTWNSFISFIVCDAVNVPESEVTLGGQSRAGSNQPRTRRRFSVRENNRTSKPA
jgi:hypothetical protein